MIDNKWFCEPDPYRKTYCFLHLNSSLIKDQQKINSWRLGFGNIQQIVKDKKSIQEDEQKNLTDLLRHIYTCQKKNLSVITEKKNTMMVLRSRILYFDIQNSFLSNLKVISLENLIGTYFSFTKEHTLSSWKQYFSINKTSISELDIMRIIYKKMVPILPREVIL